MAETPKGRYEMVGEFCREAAVLIFVFGNLDVWMKSFTGDLNRLGIGASAITKHFALVTFGSAVFEITGMFFEKGRAR